MDGRWYPVNASSSSNTVAVNKKARLSVHLKPPKNRLQWKLQEQLQQKLDAHPELADAAQSKDPALSRQLLQNQTALVDTAPSKEPALTRQSLQNSSAVESQSSHELAADKNAPYSVAVAVPDRQDVQ